MYPLQYTRSSNTSSAASVADMSYTPRSVTPAPVHHAVATRNVKRVTLTSKKNWWMVEMDDSEDDHEHATNATAHTFSSDETAVVHETHHTISQPYADVDPGSRSPTP